MARVELTADAVEDLRDLDGSALKLVLKAIAKLEDNPAQRGQPLGARQSGDLTGFRKLVVGDRAYRIVYQVHPGGDVCVIWVIAGRVDDQAYDLAMARLQMHSDTQMATELTRVLADVFEKKR